MPHPPPLEPYAGADPPPLPAPTVPPRPGRSPHRRRPPTFHLSPPPSPEHPKETSTESLLTAAHAGGSAPLAGAAHGLLCRLVGAIPELKTLYVAITRARRGCVLLECGSRPERWRPMAERWARSGLVEVWDGRRGYLREVLWCRLWRERPMMAERESCSEDSAGVCLVTSLQPGAGKGKVKS